MRTNDLFSYKIESTLGIKLLLIYVLSRLKRQVIVNVSCYYESRWSSRKNMQIDGFLNVAV